MFKFDSKRLIILILVGALSLVACDQSDDSAGGSSLLASNDSILRYVPADSPYVFASVEPLPDDILDKLEPKFDRILASYEGLLRQVMAMATSKVAEGEGDAGDFETASAVVTELSSLMSIEGLRGAGFGRESTAVFYGHGLLPVLRMHVSDGALFDAALARIETKAGQKMPVATIGNSSFRYFEHNDVKVIVAVLGDQVVITVAPSNFDDGQLSTLLGLTLPDSSIADSGALTSIADEYAYISYFVGYVDFARIVDTFISDATGLDADLIALMEHDNSELSDICRSEIRSLAGIAPRMVMGYTDISAERLSSQLVIEMRDDIASGLATLPSAVPGLGEDQGGLMSFGMSINVKALRNFVAARLDALEAEPFECEMFADLQHSVASGRMALNQPMLPMAYDFKGFVGVVNNIEGLDMVKQMPPTSIDARFLLAMNNAAALVSLGAMMSPELMGLNIEPNGEPVRFELTQMGAMMDNMYLALTDDALAISIGEGVEAELADMLSADAEENGTFLSFSMDAGRYYAFIGEAMAAVDQDDDNPMPPEFQAAMQDVMLAVADIYDRMSVDIRFTDKGIVMNSSVRLQD
ncbi:MAG: hypothetical protein IIA07_06785 [Proteobacteria bacterium]|nr:hypothetical protein [Pseudomonadota bacterium]